MQIGAAYIRVSTDDQLEFSPDAQKRAIIDYSKKNNIFLDENYIFIDEGISGRKAEKRPSFMKMIATAKKKPKPFDIILVHKFDRFARSREDSVVYKSLLRKDCNIKVISVTEQIEDDKFSIILEAMLEAMAEYYSLNLSDEVKKGMFEKARRGEHIGKAPYGYILENKNLIIDEYEAKVIKAIFDMYVNQDFSLTQLTRYLNKNNITTKQGNKWRNCTISRILQNPLYIGITRYNYTTGGSKINPSKDWILAEGNHIPIIDKEIFNKAQEIIKKHSNVGISYKNNKAKTIKSWCQHIAICSECGGKLLLHSYNKNKYYGFECTKAKEGLCNKKGSWSIRKIEKLAIEAIKNDINLPFEITLDKISNINKYDESDIFKRKLKKIENKKILIKKLYLSEVDTLEEYKNNKSELEKEEKEILKKLSELENKKNTSNLFDIEKFTDYYNILISDNIPIEKKNNIVKKFIKNIKIDLLSKELQITYYV